MQLSESQPEQQGRVVRLLAQRLGLAPETIASEADAVAVEDVQEKRRGQLARRKTILSEAVTAERTHQERKSALQRSASKLCEALENTRQELRKVESDLLDAHADAQLAEIARARELGLLEADLAHTASPAIAEFVGEMEREGDRLRLAGPTGARLRNRLTDEIRGTSNLDSVNARLLAIRDAIRAAEALRLTDMDTTAIEEQLRGLRASLPEVGSGTTALGANWEPHEDWIPAGRGPVVYVDRGPRPVRPPNANWKLGRKG